MASLTTATRRINSSNVESETTISSMTDYTSDTSDTVDEAESSLFGVSVDDVLGFGFYTMVIAGGGLAFLLLCCIVCCCCLCKKNKESDAPNPIMMDKQIDGLQSMASLSPTAQSLDTSIDMQTSFKD